MTRIAVVTGGGGGIGRAIARALSKENYQVWIVGRRAASLHSTSRGYKNIRCVVADLESAEGIQAIVNALSIEMKSSRLDLLVNNAGIASFGSFSDLDLSTIESLFRVNTLAPLKLIQGLLPFLKRSKDRCIVNISSDQASRPSQTNTLYGASKAALEFSTRSLALELAPYRVRVNAIAPGPVDTQMLWDIVGETKITTPLGMILRPHQIAETVLFILRAKMMTGAIIKLDGGSSL